LALALAAVVLLAAVAAAVAGYLWLRSYAPIALAGTSGPGPSSLDVTVVRDDEMYPGKTAYIASGERSGEFGAFFDVRNDGRLPITIEGLGGEGGGDPALKLHLGGAPGEYRYSDFRPVELEPGQTVMLGLELIATDACEGNGPGTSTSTEHVPLRYSYASVFEREASIPLPVALVVAC
jgi:hypothetical protein